MSQKATPVDVLEKVLANLKSGKIKADAVICLLIDVDSPDGAKLVANTYVHEIAHHCILAAGQCADMLAHHINWLDEKNAIRSQTTLVDPGFDFDETINADKH